MLSVKAKVNLCNNMLTTLDKAFLCFLFFFNQKNPDIFHISP